MAKIVTMTPKLAKAQAQAVLGIPEEIHVNQRQLDTIIRAIKTGDLRQAVKDSGYSADNITTQVARLEPLVAAAKLTLQARDAVMTKMEREEILTSIARAENGDESYNDRMKAVEIHGKMCGDFVERKEVTQTSYVVHLPQQIASADEWEKIAESTMKTIDATCERVDP